VTLLEFLDRMGERRAARPQRPARDIRQFIGFMFLMGYYVLVWKFTTGDVPKANIDLIRDAMLTLGPPVGLIVGAMFRSDAREEQATQNTGKAFDALSAAVAAPSVEPQPVKVMNDSANAIPVEQRP
jgi:hypothetical protein